jgi:hypothetical protein
VCERGGWAARLMLELTVVLTLKPEPSAHTERSVLWRWLATLWHIWAMARHFRICIPLGTISTVQLLSSGHAATKTFDTRWHVTLDTLPWSLIHKCYDILNGLRYDDLRGQRCTK